MTGDEHVALASLLAEQVAYYRARAPEYDATTPLHPHTRAQLVGALDAFAPRGRVLELACGTGLWTRELARQASQLTVVDASSEMLELNRRRATRPDVRYVQADLFDWSPVPSNAYDVVFFCAWLSHVPPQLFERFWANVDAALDRGGRVFVIDELPAVDAIESQVDGMPAPAVQRMLLDGTEFRAVKVLYEPADLERRLAQLGWQFETATVGWRFFYAIGERLP